MSTPVYVTFRHMAPRAELEEYAREQASCLDRFYARIVDCRVLLEPNDADVLRVVVEVTVPGERLVASYESGPGRGAPSDAERPPIPDHRWLHALHEAFDAAGGILQTYAGRRLARARHGLSAAGARG
jgi:sigma 54 modulation/S30EA-like ribosomal protein